MAKNYYDITLALAGINQSVRLVQMLAHTDHYDHPAFTVSLNSIIKMDVPSTLAIFGNQQDVMLGLNGIISLLGPLKQRFDPELIRYSAGLIHLERKLSTNKTALTALATGIQQIKRQLVHFSIDSETIISAMASIYLEIISPLAPKIQITGSAQRLQRPLVQSKVRACLLAGIRAAVLWRQVGGSRLQFIFSRNRLVNEAQHIISQV